MNIRYANINDAKILGKIHAESWKKAYLGIIPDEVLEKISIEKRTERFEKALREKTEENVIIFSEDKAAGFICIGKPRDNDLDADFGEIWGIYLHPDFFHQGIGSMLIKFAEAELKKKGYEKAYLWVLEENYIARKFYEKNGYFFDGTIKEITLGKVLKEIRYIKNQI